MIYTFYSYKGGVGRSMALANIAELLYRRGLKVLMIDFDLEAPGLELYFESSDTIYKPVKILEKRGLIDLLISYKELQTLPKIGPYSQELNKGSDDKEPFHFSVEPFTNFCMSIYKRNDSGGELFLIPAGRRSGESFTRYSEYVQSFDWKDFYANWHGEEFFDWFRREANNFADVVLLDSRTGITEMGGISTHQLADIVIMFIASNQQNLDGILKMVRSLSNPKLIQEGRKGRELILLPIPSRIEPFESDSANVFAKQFKETLSEFIHPTIDKESLFSELRINYVPRYSYQERVAAREANNESAKDLIEVFEKIILKLAQLSPKSGRFYNLYYPSYSLQIKKVLILVVNPKTTSRLRLDEETRTIANVLRRSEERKQLILEQKYAITPKDVQRAMLDVGPQIVHFSGHGVKGGLVFEDETGQEKPVSEEALANLFRLFSGEVECVILNGCYSETQAQAIAQYIPYVIGVSPEMDGKASIEFCVGFYDALGAGQTVDFAFKLGCNAIQLAGIPEHLVPRLIKRSDVATRGIEPQPGSTAFPGVKLFICYSHRDKKFFHKLMNHLKVLERQGVITNWHDRVIFAGAGDEWDHQISSYLEAADIILFLISADFLASEYCWDIEVKKAMERHMSREAIVIPVILRHSLWSSGTPLAQLQALPRDSRPVMDWSNEDEAFSNIVKGIQSVAREIISVRAQSRKL